MTYKLIALDIDGTTISGGRPPSPRIVASIAAAQEQGARVVVATGRGPDSARLYAAALGLHDALICFQGAVVKDQSGDSATLLAETLPTIPLADVIAFADRQHLELTVYTEAEIYVERQYHSQAYYDLWFSLPTHRVASLSEAVVDLTAQGRPLIKGLFVGEPDELDALAPRLAQLLSGRLEIMRSHHNFLEVLAPGVSKARALAFLAARYGIAQEHTIAVGDSGNDISMIRWAGLGIAVANAQPAVLAAADWIAPSVDEDGVATVIEKFVLRDGRQPDN